MRVLKNKLSVIIIVAILFSLYMFFVELKTDISSVYASGQENGELAEFGCAENKNDIALTNGDGKSSNPILIEGINNKDDPLIVGARSDLIDEKYIPNANYFLLNPHHHTNYGDDNPLGSCTTVAIQMLLGYHNYYSDRRIIPASFLAGDYGDIYYDPYFNRVRVKNQGCDRIGAGDGVYDEIFDRTFMASVPGIGQLISSVTDGARSFINAFADDEIKDNISLVNEDFSAEQARMYIDNGNPIVLGVNRLFEGNMHVVIAYGYAKLDGVDGFLVHYGWGEDGTMVWMPSDMFGYQVRMDVVHEHNFRDNLTMLNFYTRELVCTECGYKKPDMLYNLVGETITGVKYPISENLFIRESIELYNADTALFEINSITAIGNSAFFNQTQLPLVSLPFYVTNIGANAFAGCISLETVYFEKNLTSIGNGTFADCSSLAYFSISKNIEEIGAGAFAGCSNLNISVDAANANYTAQGNILYNKSMTEIIGSGKIAANITIPDTVVKIGESAFKGNSNLQRADIYGTPAIGASAFAECSNLNSVYFYSYNTPQPGANAFVGNTFTLYVPHSKINEYNLIFSAYTGSIDSIPIIVTLKIDGAVYQTLNTYYGAIISTNPYKAGHTFDYWVDAAGNIYNNGGVWDSTVNLTVEARWTAGQYYINFSGYGSENLQSKSVTYGQPIGELPVVAKRGNTFNGWKDEHGVFYTADYIWQRTSNLLLISDFTPNNYAITFDGNGGTVSGSVQMTVEYGTVIQSLLTATKDGFIFVGWNTHSDGSGEAISTPFTYEYTEDITLYAQFTGNNYSLTFDKQGGIDGSDGVDVVYYQAMPAATAPGRTGYDFGGYYSLPNGEGTQYYDKNMNSTHVWDCADSATLYAQWTAKTYNVYLNARYPGGTNSIFVSKSKSDIIYIEYYATEDAAVTFRTTHTIGDPYLILYDENYKKLESNDDWLGDRDSKITFNVVSGVKYFVGFCACSDVTTKGYVHIFKTITVTYDSPMPTSAVPVQKGYTFEGYYASENGNGTKYYNADMSSSNVWNIAQSATTLYANWTALDYTVVLSKDGELSGTDSVKVNYMAPMPQATAPSRAYYNFMGYYSEPDGKGKQYYNSQMNSVSNWDIAEDRTIYAYWQGHEFTIYLDAQGGYGGDSSVTVCYGDDMPQASAPLRINYIFIGYFSGENGIGTKYYDGIDMVSVHKWDIPNEATLYACWKGITYNITYENLTFRGQTARIWTDIALNEQSLNTYEFGTGLDISHVFANWATSSPNMPQLIFLGWYTNTNFTTKVTEITRSDAGNKTLYAKWRYDYNRSGRSGSYTITDKDPYTEEYFDRAWFGMKSNNLYQELKDIGIKYVYIEFKLQIREIDDGYQEVLIYKNTSPTNNPIWSVTDIEHEPGKVGKTAKYYIWHCTFSIDMLKDCDFLYIRYGAHGKNADTWVTDRAYMDIMYTTSTSSDEDIEEFYWDYLTEVKDEDCIPLEDASQSY